MPDVNDSEVQLTKREMQALVRDRRLWIVLATLGLVLGLFGPFGTTETLRLVPRLAYWLPVTVLTFATGIVLSALAAAWLRDRGLPAAPAAGLGGAAAGLPLTALVLLINLAALGLPLAEPANLTILAITVGVSAIVALSVHAVSGNAAAPLVLAVDGPVDAPAAGPLPPSASRPPALLARLPLDKRGALVSLSATDHYTEVTTLKGRDLVLIRLADAIAEASPTHGLRVHRSHWVALDQIAAVRRRDAGAEITLADGRIIPVSRSHVATLRTAGLLPR